MLRPITRMDRDDLRARSEEYQYRYDLGANMHSKGFSLGPAPDPFFADGWHDAEAQSNRP